LGFVFGVVFSLCKDTSVFYLTKSFTVTTTVTDTGKSHASNYISLRLLNISKPGQGF